jgi:hypothetical protein
MKRLCPILARYWILLLFPFSAAISAELRVGRGAVEITASTRMPIAGYSKIRINERAHEPLYAEALVPEAGDVRAALVACDLIATPWSLVEAVRKRVGAFKRIPPEHVIGSATHTHTGPETSAGLVDVGEKGNAMLTLFILGTCGNINHLDVTSPAPRRAQAEAARIGAILAGSALKAFGELQPLDPAPVAVRSSTVELRVITPSDGETEKAREVVAPFGTPPALSVSGGSWLRVPPGSPASIEEFKRAARIRSTAGLAALRWRRGTTSVAF